MWTFRQLILGLGLAALVAMGPPPSIQAGPTPSGYHWARQQTTFTLRVGDNVSGGWDGRLQQAISDWNANGTVTLKEVAGSSGPQSCPATNGMVEVCNGQYGTQVGWLGLTRLFFNDAGDHIASVTIQLNDSFFDQSNGQYNTEAARRHTICHELGHSMGLGHVNTDSCMNDSQQGVFNNLMPISKDFTTLANLYDHIDSTTTVAGSQGSSKHTRDKNGKKHHKKHDHRGDDKTQHKHAHHQRAGSESFFAPTELPMVPSGLTGSDTVIVQTLDDGQTVVTFITWAHE